MNIPIISDIHGNLESLAAISEPMMGCSFG